MKTSEKHKVLTCEKLEGFFLLRSVSQITVGQGAILFSWAIIVWGQSQVLNKKLLEIHIHIEQTVNKKAHSAQTIN